jgi:hypothetical protein
MYAYDAKKLANAEDLKITKYYEELDAKYRAMLKKWFHSPTPMAIAYIGFGECHMNFVCEFVSQWIGYKVNEISDTERCEIRVAMRSSYPRRQDPIIKRLSKVSDLYKHGRWLSKREQRDYIAIRYIVLFLCLRRTYSKDITRKITREFMKSLFRDFEFISSLSEMTRNDAQKLIYKRLKKIC